MDFDMRNEQKPSSLAAYWVNWISGRICSWHDNSREVVTAAPAEINQYHQIFTCYSQASPVSVWEQYLSLCCCCCFCAPWNSCAITSKLRQTSCALCFHIAASKHYAPRQSWSQPSLAVSPHRHAEDLLCQLLQGSWTSNDRSEELFTNVSDSLTKCFLSASTANSPVWIKWILWLESLERLAD